MTALCLVDGNALESAASCMPLGAAIWLFGDRYGWYGYDTVVPPHRRSALRSCLASSNSSVICKTLHGRRDRYLE
jgi:hypothetical protein